MLNAGWIHMWRRAVTWAVSVIVIVFLPVALLGLMLPVNDYQAQGMGSLAECDGPASVMLLVGPSLAVYTAGAVYYAALLKGRGRGALASLLAVLCAAMAVAAGGKALAAYREKSRPVHRRTCGEGW